MTYNKNGFTIVEVMIATAVFAIAITLILAGVIFIGRQYQQSSNRVALEETSRNIHQQISQSIQFSNSIVKSNTIGNMEFFCVGNDKYIFGSTEIVDQSSYNNSVSGNQAGLFLALNDDNCGANRTNEVNLIPEGARVAYFNYSSNNLTTILIKAPNDGGDLVKNVTSAPFTAADAGCDYNKPGREFCASVKFESTALGRLTN